MPSASPALSSPALSVKTQDKALPKRSVKKHRKRHRDRTNKGVRPPPHLSSFLPLTPPEGGHAGEQGRGAWEKKKKQKTESVQRDEAQDQNASGVSRGSLGDLGVHVLVAKGGKGWHTCMCGVKVRGRPDFDRHIALFAPPPLHDHDVQQDTRVGQHGAMVLLGDSEVATVSV